MGGYLGGGSGSNIDISTLLPKEFVTSKKSSISLEEVIKTPLIGIYFSAHWCGPCKLFTPKLIDFYNEINSKEKQIEIIFNSADEDQKHFEEYFGTMPWIATPFDSEKREQIEESCGVSGIPALRIFDNKGHLLDQNGRETVEGQGLAAITTWKMNIPKEEGGNQ